MTDSQLLESFIGGDQDAFARIVSRHVHWINSMATRMVRDPSLAADVTQAVFILLARKASSLRRQEQLSTWLFTATRYASLKAIRSESRRRQHERRAAMFRTEAIDTQSRQWDELAPLLDELVHQLRAADRQAVVLRFYEQQTFPQIGQALRISEEAARKRVERAVEQLQGMFARKGVAIGSAALSVSLGMNVTQPASAAVIGAVSAAPGGAAAGAAASIVKSAGAILTLLSLKPVAGVLLTVIFAVAVGTMLLQAPKSSDVVAASAPTTAPAAFRYGRVVTEDEKPLAGARVMQIGYADDNQIHTIASATSSADGKFQLPAIESGPARLLIQAAGYALSPASIGQSGADNPIDVQVRPATNLRVRFIGPDGKSITGMRVTIAAIHHRWASVLSPQLKDELTQTTDNSGQCTFPSLPRFGSAWLKILDDRFADVDGADLVPLTDSPICDGEVRLQAACTISGKVTYGDSGKPAAGIRVAASARGDRSMSRGSAVTDADGRYTVKNLHRGDYILTLNLDPEFNKRYTAAALEHRAVMPGVPLVDQDLTLISGSIIQGTIVAEGTRKPLGHANIMISGPAHPDSELMSQDIYTDADGTYLTRVPPGQNYVQFGLPPPVGMLAPKPAGDHYDVPENGSITVDFVIPMDPTPPVKGLAIDPAGKPVIGASIFVARKRGNEGPDGDETATTDSRGRFTIPVVESGSVLRARKGRWSTVTATPLGRAGENVTLTLQQDAATLVRVHVQDDSGAPIIGATVELLAGSDERGVSFYADRKKTQADGNCTFRSLYPDLYYSVDIEAKQYGVMVVAGLRGSRQKAFTFQVEPGKPLELPAFVLPKAESFVSGLLLDETGQPVEGVDIYASGPRTGTRSARTNIEGRFRIDQIVAGEDLTVSANGKRGMPQSVPAGTDNIVLNLKP